MKTIRFILTLVLFVLLCNISNGQVLLNELSNKNSSQLLDEDNEYNDWIELYNSSGTAVNLSGYYLSDDSLKLEKWAFPSQEIAPQKYLLVFASNKDRKPTPGAFHWESPVSPTEMFDYIVPTASTPANWMQPDFVPEGWGQGRPGFGSGNNDDNTVVPSGTMAVYARKSFVLPTGFQYDDILLQVDYDDGFIAYLNGVEIGRRAIFEGPTWNSPALGSHQATMYQGGSPEKIGFNHDKIKSLLVTGKNVFAIEVHNNDPGSTDLSLIPFFSFRISDSHSYFPASPMNVISSALNLHTNFKIANQGEKIYLYNKNSNQVDAISVRNLSAGWSIGRFPDGGESIGVFIKPTPGLPNTNIVYSTEREPEPVFSVSEGYYTGAQSVALTTSSSTAQIHYTTDGSEPTLTSPQYTGSPISLSASAVVRAASFSQTNKMPSYSVTNTYFINNTGHKVPVMSIATDNNNLYGTTGIFDNHFKEWEKPCYVEYFDENNNKIFEQFSGIQVDGGLGGSRSQPQHSFRLEFNNELYGEGDVDYTLITDRADRNDYKSVYLRNGSNLYLRFQFKDAIQSKIIGNNTLNYYQASKPTVVYINGNYFGQYDLREKLNDEYFEVNYNAKIDSNFYLLSQSYFNYSVLRALNGNVEEFYNDYNTFIHLDAQSPDYLQNADKILDLDYYTDYIIGGSWMAHTDWPINNIKIVKGDFTKNRWRFAHQDMEYSLEPYGWTDSNFDHINYMLTYDETNKYIRFWQLLIKDQTYKRKFINRFADLMNSTFLPENTLTIAQSMYEESLPDMKADYTRWGADPSQADNYVTEYEQAFVTFKSELSRRSDAVRSHIINNFGLSNTYNLELQVQPADASGVIQINTITPQSYPWTGTYFVDVPVRIEAKSRGNYVFDGWEPNPYITDVNNPVIEADIKQSGNKFIAKFKLTETQKAITISEINYVSGDKYPASDWVEIYNYGSAAINLADWYITDSDPSHKWIFPGSITLPAGERMVLASNLSKFQAVYPTVSNVIGPFDFGLGTPTDQVNIYNSADELIAGVEYTTSAPWPTGAFDKGMTLELKDPNIGLNNPSNWFDGCEGGSPGLSYIKCVTEIIDSSENNTATLFPNPATNKINIVVPSGLPGQKITFHLLNTMGKRIKTYHEQLAVNHLEVSVADLPKGMYLLQILIANDYQILKFIKQ